jgi:putative membrane protein insertion efficiency factor
MNILTTAQTYLTKALIGAIVVYQKTLSPDHSPLKPLFPGGVCRFEPTCSQYAIDALDAHGLSSLPLIIKRLVRCHPFAQGGHDPVSSHN